MKKTSWIIGIDEVGRGALAGPVAVAVLVAPQEFKIKNSELRIAKLAKLKDSKKLTAKQREVWFKWIKGQALPHAVAFVSPTIIDKINVSQAANLAATRAFERLIWSLRQWRGSPSAAKFRIKNYLVFLDGGLYLKDSRFKNYDLRIKTKTIIRGDEKIPAISLASIVAKVSRDKYMKKLHKKYPRYDFIHNVGYGTKKHIKAIKKYGFLPIHRRSFCKNFLN